MHKCPVGSCIKISASFLFLCMLASCGIQTRSEKIAQIQSRGQSPEEQIKKIQDELRNRQEHFQEVLESAADVADYHKLLGVAYMEQKMYALGLQSLREALVIEPENEILHYLVGLAAANLARIYQQDSKEYSELIATAQHRYIRSIELNNTYADPLYALAVLYLFENESPEDALVYLDRYSAIRSNNPRSYVLYGRAYAMLNDKHQAITYYQRAADALGDAPEVKEIEENIRILRSANNE